MKGWRREPKVTDTSWICTSFDSIKAFSSLLPQGADMLRGLHLWGSGVQEPGPGFVGGADAEEGRPLHKINFQCLWISGGEGVPVDLDRKSVV